MEAISIQIKISWILTRTFSRQHAVFWMNALGFLLNRTITPRWGASSIKINLATDRMTSELRRIRQQNLSNSNNNMIGITICCFQTHLAIINVKISLLAIENCLIRKAWMFFLSQCLLSSWYLTVILMPAFDLLHLSILSNNKLHYLHLKSIISAWIILNPSTAKITITLTIEAMITWFKHLNISIKFKHLISQINLLSRQWRWNISSQEAEASMRDLLVLKIENSENTPSKQSHLAKEEEEEDSIIPKNLIPFWILLGRVKPITKWYLSAHQLLCICNNLPRQNENNRSNSWTSITKYPFIKAVQQGNCWIPLWIQLRTLLLCNPVHTWFKNLRRKEYQANPFNSKVALIVDINNSWIVPPLEWLLP